LFLNLQRLDFRVQRCLAKDLAILAGLAPGLPSQALSIQGCRRCTGSPISQCFEEMWVVAAEAVERFRDRFGESN
jgi:hypothetical protein